MPCWHHTKNICVQIAINSLHHACIVSVTIIFINEVISLRHVGYYRKFISRFADAGRPMTKLTRKDSKFEWSDGCQTAFEYLKTCLAEAPILIYPNPHKRYIVFTDASDQAAGAVLTQEYSEI